MSGHLLDRFCRRIDLGLRANHIEQVRVTPGLALLPTLEKLSKGDVLQMLHAVEQPHSHLLDGVEDPCMELLDLTQLVW